MIQKVHRLCLNQSVPIIQLSGHDNRYVWQKPTGPAGCGYIAAASKWILHPVMFATRYIVHGVAHFQFFYSGFGVCFRAEIYFHALCIFFFFSLSDMDLYLVPLLQSKRWTLVMHYSAFPCSSLFHGRTVLRAYRSRFASCMTFCRNKCKDWEQNLQSLGAGEQRLQFHTSLL